MMSRTRYFKPVWIFLLMLEHKRRYFEECQ